MKHFRKLILLALLTLCHAYALCAQSAVDSVALQRQQGMQYLQQRDYVKAYTAFRYYLDHVSDAEKFTETYTNVQKAFHEAWIKVNSQLERSYDNATAAQKRGQQALADSLFRNYLQLCVTPESRINHQYTVALTQYALSLQRKGKITDAIALFEQVVELRRNGPHMDYSHAAETLNLIAAAESQLGHYDAAIGKCTEALKIYEKRYGKGHEHYGTTLSNLASYYTSRNLPGDRRYAVELGEQAVKALPKNKPACAQAMNNLVFYYSLSGDKVKAQKYAKAALKATRKLDKSTVNYASILSNQAVRLANANNYEQALEYAHEAIAIFEENGETQSLNYARILSNSASFEKHMEHYAQAIALWQKAAPIFERIEGRSGSGYLDCMSEISAAHAKTGNLEQAANINEELQATASEQARKGDARYARSLTKRAALMAADGNYQQAMLLERQALDIFRLRNDTYEQAASLNDISGYFYHTNRLTEAIDTCQYALQLYAGITGHQEDRALAMNNLSIYYYTQGDLQKALDVSREAVKLYEQSGNTQTSFFAKLLTNQALYHARLDSLQQAVNLSMRADSIQRRILGEIHPDNVMLMANMANYYIRLGNTQQAQRLFHEALDMQMHHVRSNFSHLTTRGRELYWGTKSYIFRFAPYMACLMEKSDSMRIDAYNAQLFTKGLLLNSEVDFRNLLAQTASAELQDKYAELAAVHQEIEQAWRAHSEDAKAQLTALTAEANRLERELMRECKEFGDFTEAMSITYEQVAAALGNADAAIEYFDIDTPEDGRTYWALLARHGWQTPKLIRLFSQNELDMLSFSGLPLSEALKSREGIHAIFEDTKVGQVVWGRLVPHLDGVKNIWFAPSGILYQWAIEYLRYDNRRLDEIFDLHRLSSTKLLAQASSPSAPNLSHRLHKAAVFGGLNYNATPSELQAANQQLSEAAFDYLAAWDTDTRNDMVMAELRTMDSFLRGERREVGPLPGTRREAELIGEALMQRNIDTEMYEGNEGTEEAFKNLNGKGFSLIHIATHGFALSEDDVRKDTKAVRYLDTTSDETAQADNSLCYSGLLMAGANQVLTGKSLPEGLENGVLTAREIAQLDLQGLDLAVLSACQTGLGELKEDGVFGLQRGFKKAGARTLLMSLWSVDDEATQIMMTHFYEALVTGQTRRQAFRTAQAALRQNPRFTSPFFWASFIMLDD